MTQLHYYLPYWMHIAIRIIPLIFLIYYQYYDKIFSRINVFAITLIYVFMDEHFWSSHAPLVTTD